MAVVHSDPGCAIATCGSCFLSIWREPSTLARLALVRQHEQALVDRHPSGIIVLTALMASAFKVEPEVREEATRVANRFAGATRAHAYVIEGSGFKTAAARAVIAGIQMFTKGPATKTFAGAEEAAAWLGPRALEGVEGSLIVLALNEARAAMASSAVAGVS